MLRPLPPCVSQGGSGAGSTGLWVCSRWLTDLASAGFLRGSVSTAADVDGPLYLLRMAGDPALAPEREMVSLHMRMLGGVLRGMTHPNSGSF